MSIIPFTEKNQEEKYWNLFDFRWGNDSGSGSETGSVFLEVDPNQKQIKQLSLIHLKMFKKYDFDSC